MSVPNGDVALVRFPHPGVEHNPGSVDVMGWNCGSHARKYLLSRARWIDSSGAEHEGEATFWGEWEADSEIVDRRSSSLCQDEPRFLHRPLWPQASPLGPHQNTDPLVFGGFTYSNCRQGTNPKLRTLPDGSIILFGSILHARFVLDTCFVAGPEKVAYRLFEPPIEAEESRRRLVYEPLLTVTGRPNFDFVAYTGAQSTSPVNGCYSFVPAQPLQPDTWGFPRPSIEIPGVKEHKGARAASTIYLSREAASDAWKAVVEQVFDAGLVLATEISLPSSPSPMQPGPDDRSRATGRC